MIKNRHFSEQYIIDKYLRKLNFKKLETFDFKNDASFLKVPKNKNIVVTNDTILESVDFYKNDPPESIASKIITCNLSDISSMGAYPYAYTLSLCLPSKKICKDWLKKFSNRLLRLQKRYNFFLIGGDLSNSDKIVISSNFFGLAPKRKILKRTGAKINEDIWISGNIGESTIGLMIRQKKIKINNSDKNYFLNKYLYPQHCDIGKNIHNYASSAIDISDGFFGDLQNLLNNNIGASINSNLIPFSQKIKKLIIKKIIDPDLLLSSGDDYQLIFTANSKYSKILKKISIKNNIKLTKVGKIIRKRGVFLNDKKIKIINKSFQHFS